MRQKKLSDHRVSFMKISAIFASFLILSKLFYLQVLEHDKFLALAQSQHFSYRTIPALRGEIFSSDGFKLAGNEKAYLLFAVPPQIQDAETAAKLVQILEEREQLVSENNENKRDQGDYGKQQEQREREIERIRMLLSDKERLWVPIARQISRDSKEKIESLNLAGIYFEEEYKRIYPEGSLAAHLLGFVGKNEKGEDQGYFGLEGFYNGDLTGRAGLTKLEKDAVGRPIPIESAEPVVPASDGRSLNLTINRELQYLIEEKLNAGAKKYQAETGSAILLEPQTGRVLALANYPSFEPGSWEKYLENESDVAKVEVFKNLAIAQNYEPGSVLKPVTMSAALETKTVAPQTIYQDNGPRSYSGHEVHTWDNKYHGAISMARILQLSNNTGIAWVAEKLGLENYWRYLQKFHLGNSLGIDLQGEERGIVKDKKEWRAIDFANAAFGQGISVTPLQLAGVYAAIANEGVLMKPYLVESIKETNGRKIQVKPQRLAQVLQPETARLVKDMLKSVITQGEFTWFVKNAGLEKFDFAGKTGTAQIPVAGGYDPHQTEVSFVGFAPTDKPRFVLLLKLGKPQTSNLSAYTAVPLWLEMAKNLFVYFGITPE